MAAAREVSYAVPPSLQGDSTSTLVRAVLSEARPARAPAPNRTKPQWALGTT